MKFVGPGSIWRGPSPWVDLSPVRLHAKGNLVFEESVIPFP